jgi:hypothetical protein
MQQDYQIEGIVRSRPGTVSRDFSCVELVNVRERGGVWRPTGVHAAVAENCLAPSSGDGAMTLFLHETGDTKQMVGASDGAVRYFDFPSGTTPISVFELPEDDRERPVRFSAVGNILVIFVDLAPASSEGGGDLAPDPSPQERGGYTRYAVWKAGEDNVKRYFLLPELPVPSLDVGLRRETIADGGQTGLGMLLFAYETLDGQYIRSSPVLLLDYGAQDEAFGKKPAFRYRKFSELVPFAWQGIIVSVSVFSSVPTTGFGKERFSDYLESDEGTFYKVFELTDEQDDLYSHATAASTGVMISNNNGFGHSCAFTIPLTISITDEVYPRKLEFGNQTFFSKNDGNISGGDTNTFMFRKFDNKPLSVHINVNFKLLLVAPQYASFPIFSLRIVHKGNFDNWFPLLNFDNVFDNVSSIIQIFAYDGTVVLEEPGDYVLDVFYTTVDYGATGIEIIPQAPYSFSYTADVSESGDYFKALTVPAKDVLVTRPALELGEVIVHDLYGACSLNYNSRLFLGDTTSLLFRGYSHLDYFGEGAAGTEVMVAYSVYLRTDDGEKVVSTEWVRNYSNVANIDLPTLFCYPDYRAYKLEVYFYLFGESYKVKEVALSSSKKHNLAYSWNFAFSFLLDDTTLLPTTKNYDHEHNSSLERNFHYLYLEFPSTYEKLALPPVRNSIRTSNNVAVSGLLLPMIYPFGRYNLVGDRRVVGFSANSLSIDASNFGVYPVFVFSENGVYAMQLGSGDVLIERVSPLSGDVCVDGGSITNVGGATVFVSRDGLRLLQGQQSQKLTGLLEHYSGNPLLGNRHFEAILEKYGLVEFVSTESDFADFLRGARVYQNYREGEVVVTNASFAYSYVLKLGGESGVRVSKTSERFYHVLNDYPNAYGTGADGQVIYDIGEEQPAVGSGSMQDVLVQTNAFKLDLDSFERIRRLLVRLRLSDGSWAGAYLFVSNDSRQWACVDGCERVGAGTNFNYLSAPGSVKYGMLVVAGRMDRVEDFISHVSVDYEKRYGEKIR